jgi:hypothetical protein
MSGALVFLHPWILAALVLLPVFWLILSALPPEPVLQLFPPIRLLRELRDETASPKKIPLWLRLIRLLMLALLITGLAAPVLTPPAETEITRPVLLVVDDGWANATNWTQIRASAQARLAQAALAGQAMAVVFSAPTKGPSETIAFAPVRDLQARLKSKDPLPFAPNRAKLAERLAAAVSAGSFAAPLEIYWLSDGLNYGHVPELTAQLMQMGKLHLVEDASYDPVRVSGLQTSNTGVEVLVQRQNTGQSLQGAVIAEERSGAALSRKDFILEKGVSEAVVTLELPLELRNRMGAVRIENVSSAGAMILLDSSWARPRLGIVGGRARTSDQPLLSESFYLTRALAPFAEVSQIDLADVEQSLPPILVLLDTGNLVGEAHDRLADFVEQGGLLIRFSGPRLAARQDDLLPVSLRSGGRLLGSALSWDKPQQFADFPDTSPFYGLDASQQVNVKRQVLADSAPGLSGRVWARLQDGTPMVTSAGRGRGRIVLFHVSASPGWSELPLSGLFVQMLKRILPMAAQPSQDSIQDQTVISRVSLSMALAADGRLQVPQGSQEILKLGNDIVPISPAHPAGLWSNSKLSLARNVMDHLQISNFPPAPIGVVTEELQTRPPLALAAPLLALALGLLILDSLAILWLGGNLPFSRRKAFSSSAAGFILAMGILLSSPPSAQAMDPFEAVSRTRLAFVITGNSSVDRLSEAGLRGLSRELYLRTTVEPAEPQAIDLNTDEINAVSFLYWPVLSKITLSETAAAKLNTYLKNGGMLILDTQDGGLKATSAGGVDPALASLFTQIDIPGLTEIPGDHVLTRAYYLIQNFPGRYASAPVWVEADRNGSSLDGVSSLVIGSNDWSAAWAIDKDGNFLAGVSGEIDAQREMARRFGINLVMYVLAGNYKADQVHIPALLERLGQ